MPNSNKPEDKESSDYKKKQALLHGPILNLSYQNTTEYDLPETLFTALKDVFEAIVTNQSRRGVVSPTKFLEVLRRDNEMFRTAMHQDAHEFLNWLLNQVVESVDANTKRLKAESDLSKTQTETNSNTDEPGLSPSPIPLEWPSDKVDQMPQRWVHDLFEGTLTSETRCLTCENVSLRDEAFLDLSVDLDQHSSVTACLRKFSEEEMLRERNKFHCDKCGDLQEAEKRMKIKRLPKILALHLKRFKYTEDLQRLQKLFHRVVYPYHLRLFNTTDDSEDPDRLYELYAIVVHIGGGPYHGHYVAIIKTEDRGWLLFDDELVEPIDKDYVRNFFGDRPGLACAYVLFYQETTLEAVHKDQEREGKPRASMEQFTSSSVNGTTNLHRVHSAVPPSLSPEGHTLSSLDHAFTAPQLPPLRSGLPTSTSPATSSPISPRMTDFLRKKDKTKEEKKTTEKERGKLEKPRQSELGGKLTDGPESDAHGDGSVNEMPLPSAPEHSIQTDTSGKENTPHGLGGLDRFKRTSKSLKFASLGRKDKTAPIEEEAEASVIYEKEKRNRFSIRKKSFGMLS
jgi:ubiquitin carboxyl-terminal hydrolase 9/13